jgi:hypothetical protein
MLLEARFANACIPDLFMRRRPELCSNRFHRDYALHLPAVLREDPESEKHPVLPELSRGANQN